jgi:hypothetical protein
MLARFAGRFIGKKSYVVRQMDSLLTFRHPVTEAYVIFPRCLSLCAPFSAFDVRPARWLWLSID